MNHPGIPGTSESAMPIPPVLQFVTQLLSTPLPRLTSAFPHRYIHPAAQTTSLPHLNFPHRQRHSLVPVRLAPCLPKSPLAESQQCDHFWRSSRHGSATGRSILLLRRYLECARQLSPCLPKSPLAEPQLAAPQLPPPPAPLSCPRSACPLPPKVPSCGISAVRPILAKFSPRKCDGAIDPPIAAIRKMCASAFPLPLQLLSIADPAFILPTPTRPSPCRPQRFISSFR